MDLTRRRFLGSAAAVAGGVGFELLPASMKKVLAAPPPDQGKLEHVEHVVILIQENRSFDHYFGSLSGVRGFEDPHPLELPTGRSVFYQPDPHVPDGFELPFHLDTTRTSAAAIHDLSHAWSTQHNSWNGGRMDSWLPAHRAADGSFGPLTMGYHTREDLPFHYALADAFTICDAYHCSVFGPTWPNRLHAMTGTADPDGKGGGPVVSNDLPPSGAFTWTTYAERLQAAGIDWRSYQTSPDGSELSWFKNFQQAPTTSPLFQRGLQGRPVTAFMDDVRKGDVAQVTWLHSNADEHPSGLPAAGAQYMHDVLDALASRPDVWAKTVLFITYDENDGFFDHVVPPTSPSGTPGEWITVNPLPARTDGIAGPYGLGFRVPMIVISPWSRGGWVCSETFDHTSTIKFIERRFGVQEPNISAWRRQTVGDMTSALRLGERHVPFPRLPDPLPVRLLEDQEVATLPAPAVPASQSFPVAEPGGARLVALDVQVTPRLIGLGRAAIVTAVLRNGEDARGPAQAASPVLRIRPAQAERLASVDLSIDLPAGWTARPTSPTTFPRLDPGGSVRATWQLTAPAKASLAASLMPALRASYQIGGDATGIFDPIMVTVPVPLAAAFDDRGISNDGSSGQGDFDGGGFSYSQQGLTAAGLGPSARVSSGGVQYAMPNVAAGQPGNVTARNQTISVEPPAGATLLAFLGSAANGDASGTITIIYKDGTRQTATLGFGDWTLGGGGEPVQFGNAVAGVTPYRNQPNGAPETVKTYIFASTPIKLAAGKTVAAIALPAVVSGGQLHIFAIGTDKGPLA